jgi:hypothetical protein
MHWPEISDRKWKEVEQHKIDIENKNKKIW